jgi:hypothetical protein
VHSGLGAEKWLWHRPPGGFADLNDNSHTSFVFPKTFLSYSMCDVVVNMFTYQLMITGFQIQAVATLRNV